MKRYYEVVTIERKHKTYGDEWTRYSGFSLEEAKDAYRNEKSDVRRDTKNTYVELRVYGLPDSVNEADANSISEALDEVSEYSLIDCCRYEVRNCVSNAAQSRGTAPHDEVPENYYGDYIWANGKRDAIATAICNLIDWLDNDYSYEETSDGFIVVDEDGCLVEEYWGFEARRVGDIDADGNVIEDDWGTEGI